MTVPQAERGVPDPNEKDTFQQVNRRAGYGANIEDLIRRAKLGYTMAQGEGAQLVAYYEERLTNHDHPDAMEN